MVEEEEKRKRMKEEVEIKEGESKKFKTEGVIGNVG
jgi:hypothetical protein